MALTGPKRSQKFAGGNLLVLGVAAAAVILQGALVLADAGYARPARAGQGVSDLARINDASNYRVVGVALESVIGGAANGDKTVEVEFGTYLFDNSAGADAVTVASIGKLAYVVDDETVALSSAGGTRPIAGIVREVGPNGVWVDISPAALTDTTRSIFLPWAINETDTLAGTSCELVAPAAGRIVRNSVIVQKAVTTGGAVTASVNGTAVDGLSCAIANGAAKGTVVTDTPTDGHASAAVAAGDRIQIAPAAAFDVAGAVSGVLEIALK